jgi:hypothetical protein
MIGHRALDGMMSIIHEYNDKILDRIVSLISLAIERRKNTRDEEGLRMALDLINVVKLEIKQGRENEEK